MINSIILRPLLSFLNEIKLLPLIIAIEKIKKIYKL